MGSCSFNQLLLKFKEVYIHANQHFHLEKQCQKIIGSCEPWLVLTGGFRETKALLKFFLAILILALSSLLSLTSPLVNQGMLSIRSLLDRLSTR